MVWTRRRPSTRLLLPNGCRVRSAKPWWARILWSKIGGRLRFTDDERRSLVAAALAMGRKLLRSVVSIVSDVLRRNRLPPSAGRKGLTWREFLARHADVLLKSYHRTAAWRPTSRLQHRWERW